MNIRDEHILVKGLTGKEKADYRRYSGRTVEQFQDDIRKYHIIEREILMRYNEFYKFVKGKDLDIIDNGVDNTGEYIEDSRKIKSDADFIVNGKPLEIKHVKDNLFKFRLKLNPINSYIEQQARILLVLGWETDSPEFTILDTEKIQHMAKFCKKEISGDWEGKPTIYVYKSTLRWRELPELQG